MSAALWLLLVLAWPSRFWREVVGTIRRFQRWPVQLPDRYAAVNRKPAWWKVWLDR